MERTAFIAWTRSPRSVAGCTDLASEQERKRSELRFSEERMDYYNSMLTWRLPTFPSVIDYAYAQRLRSRRSIYFYWFHWYRVRRAEWLTHIWYQSLQAIDKELSRDLPLRSPVTHKRARAIELQVDIIEGASQPLLEGLRETEREARARNWRIRWPARFPTMQRWISSVYGRLGPITRLIKAIRDKLKEIIEKWIEFVYVIYYSYTRAGMLRHLEAHFESTCLDLDEVKDTVKTLAGKLLRRWVTRVKYAVPLLSGLTKEDEGHVIRPPNEWQWGIQWEGQWGRWGTLKYEKKEFNKLDIHIYDFDYNRVRREASIIVPPAWWVLNEEDLWNRILTGTMELPGEEELY